MEKRPSFWTLAELSELLGGELRGPGDLRICRAAPAHSQDAEGLTFASSEAFLKTAEASGVGAVLVPFSAPPVSKPAIAVENPRETFGRFLAMCHRPLPFEAGIHPKADVSPDADVDPTASVGAFAVIERGAKLGRACRVYPFAYVGEGCVLGAGAVVFPHAVLYQNVRLGDRAIVHAGAILGADGFGYVWDGQRQVKIPQVGGVEIGEDVEIGALTAVDRSTAGDTVVERGVKLDNLVQVGHNSIVGEHTVVAALVGISGSTQIGKRVTLAGQSATSDHVKIGDDVVMGGRTGVTKDVTEPGTYWGLPARPIGETMRIMALQAKLPSLYERLKALEKRVAELEGGD
ncbi:MAG TPA: UDP-3-O-(3-hydroxymyristoyl)glucosamine N-acyltransferase [Fimbriimonas sp.]